MENLTRLFGSTGLGPRPASPRRNTTSVATRPASPRRSVTRGFRMANVRRLSRGALSARERARLRVTKPSVARAIRNARSVTKRTTRATRATVSHEGRSGIAERVARKATDRARNTRGVKGASSMAMNLDRARRRRATVAPRDEVSVNIPAGMTALEGVLGNKTFRDRLGELHDEGYTRVVREGRRGGQVVLGK